MNALCSASSREEHLVSRCGGARLVAPNGAMKPSDVIVRRATDSLQEVYKGTGVKAIPQVEVDSGVTAGMLRYLDELHARGMIPLPQNPSDPWPPTPKETADLSRRTAR